MTSGTMKGIPPGVTNCTIDHKVISIAVTERA
jgi:hypothetical protein